LAGEVLGEGVLGIPRERWDSSINMILRKLDCEDWRLMVPYLSGLISSA
jgi:hypothetical protein